VDVFEQKADQAAGGDSELVVQAVVEPRDHQFSIRVKVATAGEHRLRVWVRDVEVANSPFSLQVKPGLV
jgi:hypothetical protein